MNDAEYRFLAEFFKERSGLVLTPEKIYLIENRLLPIARQRNLEHLPDFVNALREGRDRSLIEEVTDAMTVNETFFFRDGKPFDLFKMTVLPDLVKRRSEERAPLGSTGSPACRARGAGRGVRQAGDGVSMTQDEFEEWLIRLLGEKLSPDWHFVAWQAYELGYGYGLTDRAMPYEKPPAE